MSIGALMILVSTVGFVILIPILNHKIENLQKEVSGKNEILDSYSFNYIMEGNQKSKMASTYGTYKILDSLNSTHTKEFENHLRRQFLQGIVILRNKQLTSLEVENLNSTKLENIEKMYTEISQYSTQEYNKLLNEIKVNEAKTRQLLNFRFILTVILGSVQVIGLLLEKV